tara:strand:- start:101 stop:679 length:579 start_codon:yes stop_codon:yes gene_type:complete
MGACFAKIGAEEQEKPGENGQEDDDRPKATRGFFGGVVEPYYDPQMPDIGMKVEFTKMQTRKHGVKTAMKDMFRVLDKDNALSAKVAKTIPVSDMIDRIKVTEPIVELINERRSKKEDRQFVKNNLLESQKYMALRNASLNMMNHNYSDIIVKKADGMIAIHESRTKLELKLESHLDDDTDLGGLVEYGSDE